MHRLQHILAATDLSAPARHAVARAFRVAVETGARLELMHVTSQSAMDNLRQLLGMEAAPVEARILERTRAALAQLAADLGQLHGVGADIYPAVGNVLSAITDHADARDSGLLVVGAHGEGYLGRLLLGTTAERLLRRSLRPLLLVRQMAHEPYRRVLVPVDFSPWSLSALELAQAVAPQAELVLLHAFEAPFESKLEFAGVDERIVSQYRTMARQDALNRLQGLLETARLDPDAVRLSVRHGDAPRVILTEESELDCDLIILGKHGQGAMEELLLGSVTKHVLSEAACDVLVASVPRTAQ